MTDTLVLPADDVLTDRQAIIDAITVEPWRPTMTPTEERYPLFMVEGHEYTLATTPLFGGPRAAACSCRWESTGRPRTFGGRRQLFNQHAARQVISLVEARNAS